jgi:glycosyltransferase involved in cell wall biosynthesis
VFTRWATCFHQLRAYFSGGSIAIINKRWHYHAKRSGIAPLAEGLGLIIPYRLHYLPLLPALLLYGRRYQDANLPVHQAHRIHLFCLLFRIELLLLLAGDFELELIQQLHRISRLKLCAVFHLPAARLAHMTAHCPRCMLDGAITLSRDLIPVIAPLVKPQGYIDFLHHGIDSDYFHPGALAREKILLCVGNHCRDFDLLNRIAEHFEQHADNYQLLFIGIDDENTRCRLHPRILRQARLTDQELLTFYQRATLLVMPLTAATANNAILEALACGLPVVVSDLPATRDYLTEECARFCEPGNTEAHVRAIEQLLPASQWNGVSTAARKLAEQYHWKLVRGRLSLFLTRLSR